MNTTESKYYLLGQAVRMRLMEMKEQWETLFEGTVTTDPYSMNNGQMLYIWSYDANRLNDGDVVRVAVDSKIYTYTATADDYTVKAGNTWFFAPYLHNDGTADNGTGFGFVESFGSLTGGVRESGTYHIKIERVVN